MRWLARHAFERGLGLLSLLTLATANQVLDLGALDQYTPLRNPPSTLPSNTVWLSAKDNDHERGFLVAVSPDVKKKINDALKDCPTVDNLCFQYVRGILREADLEVDSSVSRRDFSRIVSRFVLLLGGLFVGIASVFIAQERLSQQHQVPLSQFLPAAQATQVTAITNGVPLTVSAAGTAVVTVTMAPDPTTVTGLVTPSATAVTGNEKDAVAGDTIITLDASLASRLSEIMRRTTDCKEGSDFDAEQGSKRDTKYGAVVCGVRGAVEMATPGGPLHDLTLIRVATPDLLSKLRAPLTAAAQRAIDIAKDYVPLLEMPPGVFDDIIVLVFALGVHNLIDNVPLSGRNIIPKDILDNTKQIPTTTATSCTGTATACQATCTEVGAQFFACKTSCGSCATQTTSIQTVTTIAWPGPAGGGPVVPTATAHPECQMDQPGILPWNIFDGSEYNVVSHFCSEVDRQPASSRSWIVDTKGNKIPVLKQVKPSYSISNKRSPPTTPDTYKDYRVSLQWRPSPSSAQSDCPMSCAEAYRAIADSPCGHTGGEQNVMALSGSLDVTCGTYSYHIIPPGSSSDSGGTPLALQEQQCYLESQWPKHFDVHEGSVKQAAKVACGSELKLPEKMSKDSKAWEDVHMWGRTGMKLKMRVEWKDGCVLAGGEAEQEPRRPLGAGGVDGKDGCYELLYNDWKNCNNGGVGGYRQAGCLVYSFSPK
ncbi:uncharacterized protein B0T23DRAFT_43756 [Neurospora hispaniola]|uniref:Uncharacterized protein n=1 Tax=Neurospora hispaniola TaxID=588809 RepID=A0AAJ0HYH4_9PEZI|nr:hypothetical protein B0T23DRAFT_43756 [Neurospora hispaniola]